MCSPLCALNEVGLPDTFRQATHAWPVRVSQRRRGGSPRRPRGLSSKHFDLFCLSFSRWTYTIQSLSLLKRLFACTPGTSLLQWAPDRMSRSGEPSLSPAAASSLPRQSRATCYATTASKLHDTSTFFPFQIRRVYRYGAKNLYRKRAAQNRYRASFLAS